MSSTFPSDIDPTVRLGDLLGIGTDLGDGLAGLFDAVGDCATGNEAVDADFIPDSSMIKMAQCLNVKLGRRNTIHSCPGQVNGMPCDGEEDLLADENGNGRGNGTIVRVCNNPNHRCTINVNEPYRWVHNDASVAATRTSLGYTTYNDVYQPTETFPRSGKAYACKECGQPKKGHVCPKNPPKTPLGKLIAKRPKTLSMIQAIQATHTPLPMPMSLSTPQPTDKEKENATKLQGMVELIKYKYVSLNIALAETCETIEKLTAVPDADYEATMKELVFMTL